MSLPTSTEESQEKLRAKDFRILVTDDEPMLRSVITEYLEMFGWTELAEASNGIEALETIRSKAVDCLLSDIRMPMMDLEELLPKLADEYPDLNVIATSGYSDVETTLHILERGAQEFLAKPLDLDHLEASLDWIATRQAILLGVRELFSGNAELDEGAWSDALRKVTEMLGRVEGACAAVMRHACRTADLAPLVLDDPKPLRELQLAALLHEIGASTRYLSAVNQPNSLRAEELRVARLQAPMAERLLARTLQGRPTARIVGDHLGWMEKKAAREPEWDDAERLSCQLGVLNVVDALFNDRADRPKYPPDKARDILKKLYARTTLSALKVTLTRWDAIVDYYAAAAES